MSSPGCTKGDQTLGGNFHPKSETSDGLVHKIHNKSNPTLSPKKVLCTTCAPQGVYTSRLDPSKNLLCTPQKERIVFQPSIFRCELLVSGRVYTKNPLNLQDFDTKIFNPGPRRVIRTSCLQAFLLALKPRISRGPGKLRFRMKFARGPQVFS